MGGSMPRRSDDGSAWYLPEVDRDEAERMLEEVEVVPLLQLPLREAKEILEACLEAGVPALLGRDDHCTKGCAPKVLLLARAEDGARVGDLLRQRFGTLLAQEGTLAERSLSAGAAAPEGTLPCPACGTAIPDDATECPDCGLGVG
jgi:hypothetical protein